MSGWGRFTWGQAYWGEDQLLNQGWGAETWGDGGSWGEVGDENVALTGQEISVQYMYLLSIALYMNVL